MSYLLCLQRKNNQEIEAKYTSGSWDLEVMLCKNHCLFTPAEFFELLIINNTENNEYTEAYSQMNELAALIDEQIGQNEIISLRLNHCYIQDRDKYWIDLTDHMTVKKVRDNSELVSKVIPKEHLLIYYVTSGRFDLYIKHKLDGLVFPSQIDEEYFGMNNFCYISSMSCLFDKITARNISSTCCRIYK